jgi:hypothetical protein
MLSRVTATSGLRWPAAIAGQFHFSEWTLYGVFVEGVIAEPGNSFCSDDPMCLGYWEEIPLNLDELAVSFQEVVHSAWIVNADVAKPQGFAREPNGHP